MGVHGKSPGMLRHLQAGLWAATVASAAPRPIGPAAAQGARHAAMQAAALLAAQLARRGTWWVEPCDSLEWVENNENGKAAKRNSGDCSLRQVLRTRWHVARLCQPRHVSGDPLRRHSIRLIGIRHLCARSTPDGYPCGQRRKRDGPR